jgi:hypothetical protein
MRKGKRVGSSPATERLRHLLHAMRQPLTSIQLDVGVAIQLIRQGADDDALRALEDAIGCLAAAEQRLGDLESAVEHASD